MDRRPAYRRSRFFGFRTYFRRTIFTRQFYSFVTTTIKYVSLRKNHFGRRVFFFFVTLGGYFLNKFEIVLSRVVSHERLARVPEIGRDTINGSEVFGKTPF